MQSLRDRLRCSPLRRYFENLDQIDRLTFLIGVVLAFVVALSLQACARTPASEPASLTAPPFDLRFASHAGSRS